MSKLEYFLSVKNIEISLYALYETLIMYLNSVPGENPDEVKVPKVAPTDKAAFNITGNTLYSAFKIPANRGF